MGMPDNQDQTMIAGTPADDMGRTQAMPRADATQMGASVECPVCRARNIPGETYCSDCGFLLASTPGEAPAPPAAPRAKLSNTHSRQVFALHPGVYSVGREDADILLADPSVSRVHSSLEVREADALVTDLGSTNGTMVGAARLGANEQAVLEPGQEVRFGSAVLLFEMEPPTAAASDGEVDELEREVSGEPQPEADKEPEEDAQSDEAVEAGKSEEPDESGGHDEEPGTGRAEAVLAEEGASGLRFVVGEDGASIGRRGNNDIVIPDAYVSGSHAIIAYRDGGFYLTDTGSTNGTTVNGEAISAQSPVLLSPGDRIGLGQVTLEFQPGSTEQQ